MADPATLLTRARSMRREMTPAEGALWRLLRGRRVEGAKFKRQVPIGPYVADFSCFERRLIVECDGGQHADSEYDLARDAWLRREGYTVLRAWNMDVLSEPEGVEHAIVEALRRPLTSPSPSHEAAPRGPLPLPRGERSE